MAKKQQKAITANISRTFKKGDTATMKFHLIGLISEEEATVINVSRKNIVTLDNNFKFDGRTGECLNDNTYLGAKRTLKID